MYAITGGSTARRSPEATFALVSPNSWLDPDLFLSSNVIGGWIKKLAQRPDLAEIVLPAWEQEVTNPSPDGRPRGLISLLVKQIRNLGWSPVGPSMWLSAEGEAIDPTNGEQTKWHLNHALTARRWQA
eukprot:13599680-Heterocapsa_arctica.AAC.1